MFSVEKDYQCLLKCIISHGTDVAVTHAEHRLYLKYVLCSPISHHSVYRWYNNLTQVKSSVTDETRLASVYNTCIQAEHTVDLQNKYVSSQSRVYYAS